jgi:hypothetical protein
LTGRLCPIAQLCLNDELEPTDKDDALVAFLNIAKLNSPVGHLPSRVLAICMGAAMLAACSDATPTIPLTLAGSSGEQLDAGQLPITGVAKLDPMNEATHVIAKTT